MPPAIVLALFAGSIDELIAIYLRGGSSEKLINNAQTSLSGRLRPLGPLVISPASGRQVLMYEYVWRQTGLASGEHHQIPAIIRGLAMAPCELLTPRVQFGSKDSQTSNT